METNSKKIIKRLDKDGWVEVRVRGSHHLFEHAKKPGTIVVTHPRKDISTGLLRAIYRIAGWR